MTFTHTDGFPVAPTDIDVLLVGIAERYDVIVAAGGGYFSLVAIVELTSSIMNPTGRSMGSLAPLTRPDTARAFSPYPGWVCVWHRSKCDANT